MGSLVTDGVLCGPIWLGDNSSVMKQVVERLYACSNLLNEAGQFAYYGRVGGCLITGNEDGVKHCAMNLLYSMCSTSATPSHRKPMPAGSAKPAPARPTSTRAPAGRRTTSRTATPPS
jgi:multimeric flavodoxin WrbA